MRKGDLFGSLLEFRRAESGASLFKFARWVTEREACLLYFLIQEHRIEQLVECGTANGFSSSVAACAQRDAGIAPSVHTWDIVERPKLWDHFEPVRSLKSSVTQYVGNFAELRDTPLPFVNFRAFFIDGDHRARAVRRDWKIVRERLRPETDLVVFHDTSDYEGIALRVEALAASPSWRVRQFTTERGMAVVQRVAE